jgi:TolB-like protein/Tfp pilus assembly protein PilF
MGEIYRARDSRLGRDVAIKVLPTQFATEPDRLRRFEEEARAIAGLNHPNICQIYDVGPGYLVLEYIQGTPPRGPLAPDEAVRLGLQIVSALDAAHQRRILHRDLKPANILITAKGQVKLLDFGLAKLMATDGDVTRTIEGTVLGTAAYMAPEQAQGRTLDERSDIFSFGAVLYEMLAGAPAFSGDSTADILSAVLRDEPRPLKAPALLERIVWRCLAKDASQRFQTMGDVATALQQAMAKPADQKPSIAVLPFANMSRDSDDEYFSDGLAEEIINLLAHVPGLKVTARTSAFAFRGKEQDITKIAEALRVRTILEGSVRRAGTRMRVTAQLINAEDGYHLWSERYDRELTDVFAIQDDIAQAIASALQVTLTAKAAQARHTPVLAAYEAVLKGRHHMLRHSPVSHARANDCFERAMALDPQYAEPHASLGLNCFLSGMSGLRSARDTMPLVRAAAKEALSLDPSDPGPHFLLASVAAAYEYDWKQAAEHFAIAMAGASVSAEAHWAYASLYFQPLGRFEESVSHMEGAVERDPLNALWRGVLASHLTHAGLHDQAIQQANEALEIDESNIAPSVTLGEAYVAMGRWAEAALALENAYRLQPQYALSTGMLAGALVRIGEHARADQMIRELGDTPRPLMGRVLYHWICGETDQAADWYERAINGRDPFALVFADGPLGSAFRESSRWPKLASMMKLTTAI